MGMAGMKIAVYHNVPAGGAKRAIFEMVKGLARRGHTLVELVPSTANTDWCDLMPYIAARQVFPLDWPVWRTRVPLLTPYLHSLTFIRGGLRYYALSEEMAQWLHAQSFDVLFANDCSIMLNPPIAGMAGIPTLLYIHHGSHLSCESVEQNRPTFRSIAERAKTLYYRPAAIWANRFKYSREAWVARRATRLACNSSLAQRLIRRAYGTTSQVIHCGVDANVFKPPTGGSRGNYVLSAGAITPHKSFGFLIESLATLPERIRPTLWIASAHAEEDELVRLKVLAQRCHVALEIVHPKSQQELVHLYQEARVFVFAAKDEAFGMVALEAMACGTPVVGVEDGGYADAIVTGITGVVTPRSPNEFGAALLNLLENPSVCEQMGQSAREQVVSYWNWNCTATELENEIDMTIRSSVES